MAESPLHPTCPPMGSPRAPYAARVLDDVLQSVGFPGRFWEQFERIGLSTTPAIAIASQWRAEAPANRTLVLCGASGAGKTYAALGWLSGQIPFTDDGWIMPGQAAWAAKQMLYVKAYVLGRLNLRYNPEDRVQFERIKSARYLVLDDLGAEDASSVGLVEEVIDHRVAAGWRTLITTNLGCHRPDHATSAFGTRYGLRTVGRILEKGRFEKCGTDNLRGLAP